MYIPNAHRESDPATLHAFIEQHSFATLVTHHGGRMTASHLPLLLDRRAGPLGRLHGHMARANPQWQAVDGEALVIFAGPHAYVSPAWYEAAEVVPTWNYVAVHAYGTFHVVDDPAAVSAHLQQAVAFFEQALPRPWALDRSSEFFARMLRAVVGFRIDLTRVEGKWKLGQNHPEERRRRAARALAALPDENARRVAALMEQTLRPPDRG